MDCIVLRPSTIYGGTMLSSGERYVLKMFIVYNGIFEHVASKR